MVSMQLSLSLNVSIPIKDYEVSIGVYISMLLSCLLIVCTTFSFCAVKLYIVLGSFDYIITNLNLQKDYLKPPFY